MVEERFNMYSFLFKKFYSYLVLKKTETPIWHASSLVGVSMLVHFFILFKFFNKEFWYMPSESYMQNKLFYMPFAALYVFLIYIFFKRRVTKLKIVKISTLYFLILILFFVVVPLYFLILLSTK